MAQYSDTVMEHFTNPRNVGEIEDADGVGEVGNPVCGDMMTFYVKVDDEGRVEDVKYKTFGCGAAIAVSSMVSEMAKGKTVEEALKISRDDVAEELGGLPKQKMHCSNLGADALHLALEDYLNKKGKS
ncbi:MAG: Fe-S cluster assembly scaffold protein NifU [Actinomycetota bacterium]